MRKTLALALLAACLMGAAASAQPDPTPEEAFRQLEQGWMDALAAHDSVALERYLADGFTIIGAGSSVEDPTADRAAWLAVGLRRPFPRHDVRVLAVRQAGEAAVVQAVLSGVYPPMPWTPEGGPLTFLVTDTWVRRDERWQVLARHSSLVREAP